MKRDIYHLLDAMQLKHLKMQLIFHSFMDTDIILHVSLCIHTICMLEQELRTRKFCNVHFYLMSQG